MTKSLNIDPKKIRAAGEINFTPIPVNQYQKSVKDELDNFSTQEFLNIYRDMAIIREFETMLNLVKTTGEYCGIPYNHPGPAHLGIGQEAAYVGQAFALDNDDAVFGSHRSHGEILAKGLRAIELHTDEQLLDIMQNFFDGATYNVIKDSKKTVKEIAKDFLIYGTLAEIFARVTGFNKGLGGSMHAFFIPFGIYPNNAIVGGSADIATGAALYKRVNKKPGAVVCNIGDASMACGPVWEGMMFGAMDQFKTLWGDENGGGLPVIYNFFNNQYGMGGQTNGETMGYEFLARVGAGVNPEQMHAERVDGYNPLAVIDVFRRKKEILAQKNGPVLIDTITYRFSGHSPSDASTYRTKEEVAAWQEQDSLVAFKAQLIEAKVADEKTLDALYKTVQSDILAAFKLATDDKISPRMDLVSNPNAIADMMFSNKHIKSLDETRTPDSLMPIEENPRVKKIASKERYYLKDGKPVSKNKVYQYRDAVFESIITKFYEDPTLVAYGEENRDWGGAFAVYSGLTESMPYHRLFNSPIAEAAIVGTAVGYAMMGGRVICELMYADFMGRAGDEIINQMSKWQAISGNVLKMPMVLRMSVGSKYGAQHSQDLTALCAHIPGLKVVYPVTPYDAKGLMSAALNGTDPVIFLESQKFYDIGEQFVKEGVPVGDYQIEIGEPDIKRVGNDITILSVGPTLYNALKAADTLESKYNLSAEVIDARSVVPFNYEKVIESVKKTGRIVLVSDACERGSVISEMARVITELCFDYLDAPATVVGAKNWITPAYEFEDFFFPQPSWIIDAINERILPLNGHVSSTNQTTAEQIRTNKLGI